MVFVDENESKGFLFCWNIENFDFCWHKTGDFLQSPVFNIDSARTTNWRLWLYPRGVYDGEYVSCYLFRESCGPETVEVDFELSLCIGDVLLELPISFFKIFSFKCCDKIGRKSYIRRREIFLHESNADKEVVTLTLRCRILKMDRRSIEAAELFGQTTIEKEHISATQMLDQDEDLDLVSKEGIQMKPLLENDPLMVIRLYHVEDSLVIRIRPVKRGRIKYAVCHMNFAKWSDESRIHHIRSWIGDIEIDTWRYDLLFPETESPESSISSPKILFFHCDLTFSSGRESSDIGLRCYSPYTTPPKATPQETMNENSALASLERTFRSKTFADMRISLYGKKHLFPAHKALFCARSSFLKSMETRVIENFTLCTYEGFAIRKMLLFVYTDKFETSDWPVATEVYKLSTFFELELLKLKCRDILLQMLDIDRASTLLRMVHSSRDRHFQSYVEKFILRNQGAVFRSRSWHCSAKAEDPWFTNIMIDLYKMKSEVHVRDASMHK